jgi:PTS system fructose-specific IIC component
MTTGMSFWELFSDSAILDDLAADDKESAFSEILENLATAKRIVRKDLPQIKRRLNEREKMGSTGIGNGVAVPHVKISQIKSVSVCLARSKKGIEYQAIDGRPVHTIFMILAPVDASQEHLGLLRWISSLARDADFRRFVLMAKDSTELLALLRERNS